MPTALKVFIPFMVIREGFVLERACFNFVSKEEMYRLNKMYLQHDTDTDVITYDYTSDKSIDTEVFISEWALQNAPTDFDETPENECLRLIFHGLLHCMSYSDKTDSEKEPMRAKEDDYIQLFHVKHSANV